MAKDDIVALSLQGSGAPIPRQGERGTFGACFEDVEALADYLLVLAGTTAPGKITAGPPHLPDLVRAMVKMAHSTPGFACRAMLGRDEVAPEEWRQLGRFYLALGQGCMSTAAAVDMPMTDRAQS